MTRQTGFTLIEVLIAMAITAILAMIAYAGLDSAAKLAETAELEADRLQKVSRVFDIISRDFRQIAMRPVRSPSGEDIEPAFLLDRAQQPLLRFSRAGWINPQPSRFQRSELQRINYHYDGAKLIRYSWQMLDRYDDSQMQEVVLLDNVRSFEVRALSDVGIIDSNGQVASAESGEWINSWPAGNLLDASKVLTDLPVAVEITLEIEGWGKIRRVYELVAGATW